MEHLCKIAIEVRWKKLWDLALDHDVACISSLRNLARVISHPKHAPSPCPTCDSTELRVSLLQSVMEKHTYSTESWDTLLNSLLELDPSLYGTLLCFMKLF